ncbi:MAG: tyrosine-protein phosphatase [Bacilli bacterium]|nr:tyrosine-protein phosphatase [Bacilli bacterium]
MKKSNLLVLAAALLLTACATTPSQSVDPSSEESIVESSNVDTSSQGSQNTSQGGLSSVSNTPSTQTDISYDWPTNPSSQISKPDTKTQTSSGTPATVDTAFEITTDLSKTYDFHTDKQKKFIDYTGDFYHLTESILKGFGVDGKTENSFPNQLSLAWNHTPKSGKTLSYYGLKLSTHQDMSDGFEIKGTTAKSLSFYNAFLGDNYFQVTAHYSDGTVEGSEIKTLHVTDKGPRNLKIGNMSNCRDIGGRTTVDGGKIRQGLLFRTADPSGNVNTDVTTVLVDQFKVKSEIYVKDGGNADGSKSPLGTSVKFFNCSMDYGATPYSNLSRNSERLRKVFSILAEGKNYPVMYHCRIGTDRTGVVGILTNGVLGMSFEDVLRDYGFSNYGKIDGLRYTNKSSDPNGDDPAKYVDEILKMPGANFQEQCYNALRSVGVPQEHIESFIDIMIEGNKPTNAQKGQIFTTAEAFGSTGLKISSSTDYTNPAKYYAVAKNKSVAAKATTTAQDYSVVVYVGCTNSSSSTKLNSGIYLTIDGKEATIANTTSYQLAGFGTTQQSRRTGYMFEILGKYSFTAGEHTIGFTTKGSDTFNVAGIHLIPGTAASYK